MNNPERQKAIEGKNIRIYSFLVCLQSIPGSLKGVFNIGIVAIIFILDSISE